MPFVFWTKRTPMSGYQSSSSVSIRSTAWVMRAAALRTSGYTSPWPSTETISFGTMTSRTDIPLTSTAEKVKSGSCGTISRPERYAWLQCTSKSGEHSLTRSATALPRIISSRPVCQHLQDAGGDVTGTAVLAADETADVSYRDSANFPNVSSPRNRVMIRGQNPHGKYDIIYSRTMATAGFDISRTFCRGKAVAVVMAFATVTVLLLGNSGADRNSSPAYE